MNGIATPALQVRGIEKGDRVAVLDPNAHSHLEAAYGIVRIGAVHTPLNYRFEPAVRQLRAYSSPQQSHAVECVSLVDSHDF